MQDLEDDQQHAKDVATREAHEGALHDVPDIEERAADDVEGIDHEARDEERHRKEREERVSQGHFLR